MKCTCGYEVHDPPYEGWEECGNCEQRLHSLEWRKKQLEDRRILIRIARAAKLYLEHGEPGLADDLEEVLERWFGK